MKFTQPITRTIAPAHDSGLPRVSGEGRLRARTPARFRARSAYSSFKCRRQTSSIRATMWSCADRALAAPEPMAAAFFDAFPEPFDDRVLAASADGGAAGGGSVVTIPRVAFASLYPSLRLRLIPGPKTTLYALMRPL